MSCVHCLLHCMLHGSCTRRLHGGLAPASCSISRLDPGSRLDGPHPYSKTQRPPPYRATTSLADLERLFGQKMGLRPESTRKAYRAFTIQFLVGFGAWGLGGAMGKKGRMSTSM